MKSHEPIKPLNTLLKELLRMLGNDQPTLKQLQLIEKMLITTRVDHKLSFARHLTAREKACLLLAAKGLTSAQSAELLSIKKATVDTYRRTIKRKLASTTIAEAVYKGIHFGYIRPYEF
jgi:DNA-binding CsgD family transcriptional regulator